LDITILIRADTRRDALQVHDFIQQFSWISWLGANAVKTSLWATGLCRLPDRQWGVPCGPAEKRLMLVVHRVSRIERSSELCPFASSKPSQPDIGWHIQEHHKIKARGQSIAPACNRPGQHPLEDDVVASESKRRRSGAVRLLWKGGVVGKPVDIIDTKMLTSHPSRERTPQR
jgi:hypothetical protein